MWLTRARLRADGGDLAGAAADLAERADARPAPPAACTPTSTPSIC
ncbi:hypothetical protein O1L55_35325 [Streptomyces albulus]|nr:hypothetical protein [Streptomyces noursei]